MKRLLFGAAFLLAATLRAQTPYSIPVSDYAVLKNGGLAVPSGYLTIQDEGGNLNQQSVLNFIGAGVTCADDAGNFRTNCTIPGGGGSTPTGTGFYHVTAGVMDAASKTVDLSSADATGTLAAGRFPALTGDVTTSAGSLATSIASAAVTYAKFQNIAANAVAGRASNSSGVGADIQATVAGTSLTFDGTNLAFTRYPVNPATEAVLFDDFYVRPITGASFSACGLLTCFQTGAGSGPVVPSLAADGNHPGIIELNTGTTATGAGAISGGVPNGNSADSIVFGTNAASVEWVFNVPTASDATNTFRTYVGFCDKIDNSDCVDGAYVYWDNNTDTHWGCSTASNNVRTATISTTVATANAWHKAVVSVNAAGTSVSFTVDGSALSCSPLATNIPTGITRGTALTAKVAATAGTTSVPHIDVDYVYFRQAVSR